MYVIDGLFLTQNITGIQRYAYEITMELDKLVKKDGLQLLVPDVDIKIPLLNNIKIVRYGKQKGVLWQQIDFKNYAKRNNLKVLCFTNILPVFYRRGIVVIHDVSYKANPQFFKSNLHGHLSALWHRFNYYWASHSNMQIVTVSNFSKSEIIKYYRVKEDRFTVAYNAWQHMLKVDASNDTFDRYKEIEKGNYYFSMSTLAANKNFKWILYAAKSNPSEHFAIAGGGKLNGAAEASGFTDLDNVHFLGYVSDEDAKTLLENCKGFLFPTLYEGFGIPPLEAIACGCKNIIVSDTPCMHEVYSDYASYINPLDYNNIRINDHECDCEKLLDKYSWENSAKIVESLINE